MARDAADLLSERLGIETEYVDQSGQAHRVPQETLCGLWAALGLGEEEPAAALRRLEEEMRLQAIDPVQVVGAGRSLEIALRAPARAVSLPWEFAGEDGETRRGVVSGGESGRVTLPIQPPLGYHRLRLGEVETSVIVVPERAYEPPVLRQGRAWGISAQLYGLRSLRNWGIGDFSDLTRLIEGAAATGASTVGVNPLHALFLDEPERASPYSPSSRLFLNPLYIDVTAVEDFADAAIDTGGLEELRAAALVDYGAVTARKREAFEKLYDAFCRRHLSRLESPRAAQFRSFQRQGGAALRHFAVFQVLRETLGARDTAKRSWRYWPAAYRQADRAEVVTFAAEHRPRVEFHEYLQWQADLQLGRAAAAAASAGMRIGLYRDLAVGVEADSGDAWSAPALAAEGWSIGAPPDAWNRSGQDWGLLPPLPRQLRAQAYASFVAMLRANMRHAGALRIDHILGLRRLFWVPRGAPPAAGAYVHYPFDELLGIIALESVRNRCLVIGEDLGTVPPGFSEALQRRAIYSYRLLYFETGRGGRFKPPQRWPKAALAGVSTHDLPTLTGFWSGRDIEVKRELGLYHDPTAVESDRQEREKARQAIGEALGKEGLWPEPAKPPIEEVHRFLARTRSRLALVQIEDLLGIREQANMPGTIDQHPNWRRKLPVRVERLFDDPAVQHRAAPLAEERPRGQHRQERSAAGAPRATYRLQLNKDFDFDSATAIVPYLRRLGISHVYVSPILEAQPGSPHGYDVTSFDRLNPELGPPESFERFSRTLREHRMKLLVDFVPNHMGIGKAQNRWWLNLLERGRQGRHSHAFDIDWRPPWPELQGKVLVPFLGGSYGAVLERCELKLRFDPDTGGFDVWYFEHRFPINPADYETIIGSLTLPATLPGDPDVRKSTLADWARKDPALRAALEDAAARFNGPPFQPLHELLERQAYRLASWRAAATRANYRRFFDVNELAGLCMDRADVFASTHQMIAGLIEQGHIHGLRIDHVDGLRDPAGYCQRLRRLVTAKAPDFYIVVEKILARHERLREGWQVDGTTGYEFIDLVNGLLVYGEGLERLSDAYKAFVGEPMRFSEALRAAKEQVIDELFAGGLATLAVRLGHIGRRHWSSREFDADRLRQALRAVIIALPVYRTYITRHGADRDDRREIDWALRQVRRRAKDIDPDILAFIHEVLCGDLTSKAPTYRRDEIIAFVMSFQQFTAPIMAKAFEDTLFYRDIRLLSLNEVGGNPGGPAISVSAFHRRATENRRRWPQALLATATHDTKRGEDARARLHVLSEIAERWRERLGLWSEMNRCRLLERADEYMLYQTLVGAWPADWLTRMPSHDEHKDFSGRIKQYLVKALREGKRSTSWLSPDAAYEKNCQDFIDRILDASSPFATSLREFVADIAPAGALNSLAQMTLKLTMPGVPDIYRGCELWDFALVDPDNRRPVDFARRRTVLESMAEEGAPPAEFMAAWPDGRIKTWLLRRLLRVRERYDDVFRSGDYVPLAASGHRREHVIGFMRRYANQAVIVVVGRHFMRLRGERGAGLVVDPEAWGDTIVRLPDDISRMQLQSVIEDAVFEGPAPYLQAAQILRSLPVAVLSTG